MIRNIGSRRLVAMISSIEFWFGISLGILFEEFARKALRARLGISDVDVSTPTDDDESAPTEPR